MVTSSLELLKQDQYVPLPVEIQVVLVYAGMRGFLDKIPATAVRSFELKLLPLLESLPLVHQIKKTGQLNESLEKELRSFLNNFLQTNKF